MDDDLASELGRHALKAILRRRDACGTRGRGGRGGAEEVHGGGQGAAALERDADAAAVVLQLVHLHSREAGQYACRLMRTWATSEEEGESGDTHTHMTSSCRSIGGQGGVP